MVKIFYATCRYISQLYYNYSVFFWLVEGQIFMKREREISISAMRQWEREWVSASDRPTISGIEINWYIFYDGNSYWRGLESMDYKTLPSFLLFDKYFHAGLILAKSARVPFNSKHHVIFQNMCNFSKFMYNFSKYVCNFSKYLCNFSKYWQN